MSDLISRSALGIGYANPLVFDNPGYAKGWNSAVEIIKNAPAVDAVPVVHGRWVRLDAHRSIEQFKCSVCRSECYVPTCMYEPMYAYCPNCGAKMDGGKEDATD